jgi:hypothetical protein
MTQLFNKLNIGGLIGSFKEFRRSGDALSGHHLLPVRPHLYLTMWSQLLLLLPLSAVSLLFTSAAGLRVEPRSLTAFSDSDLKLLASSPDPVKHIDPYNPHSHLYKILIPRARKIWESFLTSCQALIYV